MSNRPILKRNAYKSILLATAGALAFALPLTSYAQDAAPKASSDTDTVVVTGVRAAVRSARNIKKNASQIVDSIQATDIGKLPDVNTVESLQRVAGVQIQRRYGEGGTDYDHRTEPAITIRGMTQVRNLIDGRDFFTANGGRAPDLEGLPSELMAGVDVYKNAASNLIEGGVGGVVDIRTRLPFDSKLPVNSITLKANYYDRARKTSPSISALFSRQYDTAAGRMGFLVNASVSQTFYRQDAVLQQQQHCLTATVGDCDTNTTTNPLTASKIAAYNSMPNKGTLKDVYVPTSFEIYQDSGDRVRKGLALAYQWQPNERMLFTAQNLHSEYQFIRRGEYLYGDDKNNDPQAAAGSTFTWGPDGNATSGILAPQIYSTSRFDQDVRNNTNLSTLNFKWQVTDRLKSKTDFAYEYATYEAERNGDSVKLYDNESRSVANIPNLQLAFDVRGKLPVFSIVDPANPSNPYARFGNPNNWYYEWIANAFERDKLKMTTFTQDFDYDNDGHFFNKLHAGVRVADTKVLLRGNWDSTGLCNDTGVNRPDWGACPLVPVSQHPNLAYAGPASNFMQPGIGFAVGVFPEYDDPKSSVYNRTVKTYAELFAGKPNTYTFKTSFSPGDINTQQETTTAAYVTADFGTKVAGYDLDGTIGVRAVKTRLKSIGYLHQGSVTKDVNIDNEYSNVLPSFNARFHLSDEFQIRAAFGQTLTRPNFSDMAAHVELNPNVVAQYDDQGRPTGSSGNPYLKPMTATSYDLSAEYYWGSSNLAFFGIFKKDVDGYEASKRQVMNFDGVDYDINTNVNLGKGKIQGFETGYTQFFDFLPGLWSGLGIQANYTYVDSAVDSDGKTIPLPKLSKDSYNIIGLYEKGPIQARIAYNWRSAYLDQINGSGVFGFNQFAAPYSSLDASASYRINKVFTVSVDAVNLGNSMYHTYVGKKSGGLLWQLNDRRYSISLKANF